jgi:predicted DsbA family dithiol-disulfide isomerase
MAQRSASEVVRFHVDPLCPWCYQALRWVRRLEELGVVRVEWAVFSLALANRKDGDVDPDSGAGRALRTAVAVREAHGNRAMGDFFASLGALVHEQEAAAEDLGAIGAALRDPGLDGSLLARALDDPETWRAVVEEHDAVVREHRAFGVPTIVLDGGAGPAIFGPVISELPPDEEAVELWRHVSWLVRNTSFSELKRSRPRRPTFGTDVGSTRRTARHSHAA